MDFSVVAVTSSPTRTAGWRRRSTNAARSSRRIRHVGLGDPFRVTCESVEAVHPITESKLLTGCDDNLANTGRNPTIADDTELIVVKVPDLCDQSRASGGQTGCRDPRCPGSPAARSGV